MTVDKFRALLKTATRAIFLLTLFLSAQFAQAQQMPMNYVAAFNQAQEKRIQADKKLLNIMEDVADWLTDFRFRNGSFPEPGVDQDSAIETLRRKLLVPNPYTMTGVASEQEKKAPCQLRFVSYAGLNGQKYNECLKLAPSDWRADPGSITVVYDHTDAIMIWGAGADHMPIYDAKNNKLMLAWREIGRR